MTTNTLHWDLADSRTGPVPPVATSLRASSVDLVIERVSGRLTLRGDNAYFWSAEWQQGEREADADIAAGRVVHFDDATTALQFLDELD